MQIKYLKHTEINFEKWDNTILSSEFPFVFAQSYYLNSTSPNWEALVIGDYESVFPLTQNVKFGISYLHQPPFTPQLGIYGIVNSKIEEAIYNYISLKYKLIEIELNASNTFVTKHHSQKSTYFIEYEKSYKQNQNTKRNISKAIENGLQFEAIEYSDVLKLSKTYLNPFLSKTLLLSSNTIEKFNALLINAMANHSLFSFKVADSKNNVKALAHFISNGKHTVYLKGTNFDKSENSGSMHYLTHSAIQFFENKSRFFDFGGGSKESLATFYKGFGALPINYNILKINNLPWLIKLLKK
jgi:hypothetical protein